MAEGDGVAWRGLVVRGGRVRFLRAARKGRWPVVSGHPVRVRGLPSLDDATSAVLAEVPGQSPLREDPGAVRAVTQRYLATGAWPFDLLLGPATLPQP